MFWPKGKHLVYNLTNLFSLSIIIPSFLHTTLYATWTTPSFNCKHPSMCIHTFINPMGIHLLHYAHGNECMMQFTTPLLPLCKMFVSMSNENNYMRFFQPHSTHRVNESTKSRNSFEIPPCESREKVPCKCRCGGVMQKILYGGRWWLPPSLGRNESCESKVARDSS
jgi:hypothetical protein